MQILYYVDNTNTNTNFTIYFGCEILSLFPLIDMYLTVLRLCLYFNNNIILYSIKIIHLFTYQIVNMNQDSD